MAGISISVRHETLSAYIFVNSGLLDEAIRRSVYNPGLPRRFAPRKDEGYAPSLRGTKQSNIIISQNYTARSIIAGNPLIDSFLVRRVVEKRIPMKLSQKPGICNLTPSTMYCRGGKLFKIAFLIHALV
jgi:hypothetical protein